MFHLPMETLSHFIISSVLVFCNGLTPFYGYALRTFFTRKKGNRHVPCGIFMENSATYHCCQQVLAFCSLDGSFHTKGGASQPAHIPTLIVMVDSGESKLSHKFIAISCPFQLCCRRQHVKMSKWFSHFGDDHHEVNETEQQRRPSRR